MSKAGRPLLFQSVDELQEKIDSYFNYCDDVDKPYTISGLAVFLKTSRQTLVNYEAKEQFFDTIKEAKSRCEAFLEEGMLTSKLHATASIFCAKNNYGWRDKQEQEHSGDVGLFLSWEDGDHDED